MNEIWLGLGVTTVLVGVIGFILWFIGLACQVKENKQNISGLFNHLKLETTVSSTNIVDYVKEQKIN